MDTQQRITTAADQLSDTLALKLGELADEILGLPQVGSNEWLEREHYLRANPQAREQASREWHLTKLAIARQAGTSPLGIVVNAKEQGASWQTIADVYGITRQAAQQRWADAAENYIQRRTTTERVAEVDQQQIPGQTSIPVRDE